MREIKEYVEKLERAKSYNMTLKEYCRVTGESIKEYKDAIAQVMNSNLENKEDIKALYDSLNDDSRYNVTPIRENGKIVSYEVTVKVRDSKSFHATLSREEAETLFGLYTYYGGNITARNVANEFPKYTLPEVKKLFRAFQLTKDSAWFPPHLAEEMTEEELATYRMNLKERAAFKYADARQEKDFKNTLNKMASEINKYKDFKGTIQEILLNNNLEIPARDFSSVTTFNTNTLVLFLADMHIGASVSPYSVYGNQYDMNEVYRRLSKIIGYVISLKTVFNSIYIVNLGDSIDGIDSQTARGGNYLPQNMTNQEQVNNFVSAVMFLFKHIIENKLAGKYYYYSVPCGNHGGVTEYAATQLVATKLQLTFPQVETKVSDSYFLRFDPNDYVTEICHHGKDDQFMKKGYPINLDDKSEIFLNQYLSTQKDLKENINVVSGDLHNESMSRAKTFKYWKVGSFFGSSDYCQMNFGNTDAHVNYQILLDNKVLNGTIEL